ncbi:hypothetical protein [Polyangium sp. 6x1]|uniref:hypothetical protein n=1 Tax=Polyangium sp. 6x1 TaxID=3042689 RepID=UPI002482DCCC|nr:hypothetical protein [Polyangium sp. 6x1]MDI1444220.1 hypothetical protein [Polyangium sp. 6x1]
MLSDEQERFKQSMIIAFAVLLILRGVIGERRSFAVRSHACGFCKLWRDMVRAHGLKWDAEAPLAIDTPAPHPIKSTHGPLCESCVGEMRTISDVIDEADLGPLTLQAYTFALSRAPLKEMIAVARTRGLTPEAYAEEFAADTLRPFAHVLHTTMTEAPNVLH